jgi:hypothetical protein
VGVSMRIAVKVSSLPPGVFGTSDTGIPFKVFRPAPLRGDPFPTCSSP